MIGIVDYDAGNIRSVTNALTTAGIAYVITADRQELASCDGVILPGVGAAPGAMRSIRGKGLEELLRTYGRPLLGICLGMQVLFDRSAEGPTSCLGILAGTVEALPEGRMRIPHMGWNSVAVSTTDPLFQSIGNDAYFYFAHSYAAPVGEGTVAESDCGLRFAAAVRQGTVCGVQFHPEKSGAAGLQLLKNFEALCKSFRR